MPTTLQWVAILASLTSGCALAQMCPPDYRGNARGEAGKERISCEESAQQTTIWTIERPEVRQPVTEYPFIEFKPGYLVTVVDANGCVDTGGKGKTWKRYVDPAGENTDRLYHGLIWIPGARIRDGNELLITPVSTFPVRIDGVLHQQFLIQEMKGRTALYLSLGYEDDEFDDNNYVTQKRGNGCEQDHDAIVKIEISNRTAQAGDQAPLLSFDPVSKDYDVNGFLLSPAWFGNYKHWDPNHPQYLSTVQDCENFSYTNPVFVHHGVESPCTKQASFDVPPVLTSCLLEPGLGELHGHVNWAPATYYGKVSFGAYSVDNDLDFDLTDFSPSEVSHRFGSWSPPGHIGAVLSKESQFAGSEYDKKLHMEFGGYEVTEFFREPWEMFHYVPAKDVDHQTEVIHSKIDGHTAVITGLLDLDCVHDCHAELHPIHAMAIRARFEDRNPDMVLKDDEWMIFARNFGNEGSCSSDEHYLGRDSYSVFLPAPIGGGIPRLHAKKSEFKSNVAGLHWKFEPVNGGVVVTFYFTPGRPVRLTSGTPVRVSGSLRINWTNSNYEPGAWEFDETPPVKNPAGKHHENSMFKATSSAPAVPGSTHVLDLNRVELGEAPVPYSCSDPQCRDPKFIENQLIGDAQDFVRERQYLRDLKKQKGSFTWSSALKMALTSYWRSNVGFFAEGLHSTEGSVFLTGGGSRVELIQTPLGSLELEAGVGFHPTSQVAEKANAVTVDWMLGPRVQVTRHGGIFVEAKWGQLFRWSDAPLRSQPGLTHFDGHSGVGYYGVGGQPGVERARTRFRYSAGVLLPGNGESIIRVTLGLQIRFRKEDSD